MNNQNPSIPEQNITKIKSPKCFMNLGTIPTSYKDSMNYYQTVAWLCKYLQNDVIPAFNNVIENVNELQDFLQDFSVDIEQELEQITNSIPTKLSQLENDTNFINKDVNDLTNYYDKSYINNLIGDIATLLDTINGEVI